MPKSQKQPYELKDSSSHVMDVSPYFSAQSSTGNINSYVKSQNYYKKFFQKKMPVMVQKV